MPLRADQISGFLPKTIISSYRSKDECSYWNGYNQALSEISPKELTLSKEKIKNILESMMERESKSDKENPGCFMWVFCTKRGIDLNDIADALKATEHTLIEVKKEG